MPASAPYPALSDVMIFLRVQVNDAIVSNGGQTLTNTAAFTPYYANRGYQMFQQELLNMGYVRLIVPNYVLPNLPTVYDEDTSRQVWLDWTGYFDGNSLNTSFVLPQDLIRPLKLSERLTGTAPNTNLFWDMSGPEQGVLRIPSITKDYRNRIWTWDRDRIWMPGAVNLIDLRADYAAYLADFDSGDFPGTQVVPIMRSVDALAWYIAYVFSYARNDDPAVCSFALGEARRAAGIIAGMKPPTEVQAVQ